MTNDEITEFVKELRKISHQTAMVNNTDVAGFIGKRNILLRKAADLVESLQETIITIDNKALLCANLLETHFQNQEELERLKQQQDDYGEEIK